MKLQNKPLLLLITITSMINTYNFPPYHTHKYNKLLKYSINPILLNTCTLPKVTGPSRASFRRYYYDSKCQKCKTFTYGGCRGNSNNFKSLKECINRCGIKNEIVKIQMFVVYQK